MRSGALDSFALHLSYPITSLLSPMTCQYTDIPLFKTLKTLKTLKTSIALKSLDDAGVPVKTPQVTGKQQFEMECTW